MIPENRCSYAPFKEYKTIIYYNWILPSTMKLTGVVTNNPSKEIRPAKDPSMIGFWKVKTLKNT